MWVCVVAAGLASACGGGGGSSARPTAPPEPVSSVTDMFHVDTMGGRYHPMHRAAFGPIYASGCPVNGDCGCGRSTGLAEEFNCQLDQLANHDIPITAYLFDGSAWSRAGSNAQNSCEGPDCCVWELGDQVIDRLAHDGVRGLLHFWGGCHNDEQFRRASTRLGGNLLGFYLDDGSSDSELADVSQFMESTSPGDWENVAKAFQNRQPSNTSHGALALGERRLRRRPAGGLRRPEAGGHARAGPRTDRAGPDRRAHGLRLRQGQRSPTRRSTTAGCTSARCSR